MVDKAVVARVKTPEGLGSGGWKRAGKKYGRKRW